MRGHVAHRFSRLAFGDAVWSVAAAALMLACQDAPRDTGQEREPTAQRHAPLPAAPSPTVVARPDFSGPVDAVVLGHLPGAEREKIPASPVPVLLPKDPALLSKLAVSTGPHWVAFSVTHEGVTTSLHATRVAHVHPDMPPQTPDRDLRKTKAFVGQNELIWNASWQEREVAYSLDLECAVTTDARCADERFLIGIAESLVYVGGSAKPGEP